MTAYPSPPYPRPPWIATFQRELAAASPEYFSRFLPPPDEGGRESAVLILFGPHRDGGDEVVLIERAHTMRSHAGQVAFPGGAVEPGDLSLVAAALRESAEEIGLDPAGVDIVAELPSLWLPPSGFVVTPVLAWWRNPSFVHAADPGEVAQVVQAPVSRLVDPALRHTVTHPSGFVGPAFELDDLLVWGFTALLLDRVLHLAGLSRPWDQARELPLPARFIGGGRRS